MEAATSQTESPDLGSFVERFTDAWANPQLERFQALFHSRIVLDQPLMPRMVGKEQTREGFRRLLGGLPGLRGEVLSWSGSGELVFIELRLETGGGRPFHWTVTDKITLEDGLIRERISYFDPLPVIVATLARPSLWAGMVRVQLSR